MSLAFTERDIRRFIKKCQPDETGCWIWLCSVTKNDVQYGRFGLTSRKCGWIAAHRFAYEVFIGPVPDGACVLHHCDNGRCCNPRHLWIGTRQDNNMDRDRKERNVFGAKHPMSKLTERDVVDIRTRYANGESASSLIQSYSKIHKRNVFRVLSRKTWRRVNACL